MSRCAGRGVQGDAVGGMMDDGPLRCCHQSHCNEGVGLWWRGGPAISPMHVSFPGRLSEVPPSTGHDRSPLPHKIDLG